MRTWRKWSVGLAAAALLSVGATASRAGAGVNAAPTPVETLHLLARGSLPTSQAPSHLSFERVATIQTTHDLDGPSLGEAAGEALPIARRPKTRQPSLNVAAEPTANAQGPEFVIAPPDASTPAYDPTSVPLTAADAGPAFYSRETQRPRGFSFTSSDGTAANEPTPHAIPFQTSAQLFPVGAVLAAYAIYRVRRKRSRTVPLGR